MLFVQGRLNKIFLVICSTMMIGVIFGCENYGRGSDAKSASYKPESPANADAIAVMQGFFGLEGMASFERQGGSSAESHNPCSVNIRSMRESEGQGRGFEIVLSEAMEGKTNKTVQFRVWDFAPSQRAWSYSRDVGSVVKKPFELRLNGMILTAAVRAVGFNSGNILMFQQSFDQELAVRKASHGALEVTIKNSESGVLSNLLTKPDVLSCRFDSTNV